MKQQFQDQRNWHERKLERQRTEPAPQPMADLSALTGAQGPVRVPPPSDEPVSERPLKPGKVGLANEARPGLGTRANNSDPAAALEVEATRAKKRAKSNFRSKPTAAQRGYEEPRPEPREQAPDSLAHEQERQTGVSGHSSAT